MTAQNLGPILGFSKNKLRFSKNKYDFLQNKLRFSRKTNSDFQKSNPDFQKNKLRFSKTKLRFSKKQTPIFEKNKLWLSVNTMSQFRASVVSSYHRTSIVTNPHNSITLFIKTFRNARLCFLGVPFSCPRKTETKRNKHQVVIIWAKVKNENSAGIPNKYDLQKLKKKVTLYLALVLATVLLGPVSRKVR